MAAKPLPSQEVLRQLLNYDPSTGVLTWRFRPNGTRQWNSRYPGTPAFTKALQRGYLAGQIFKVDYLAHRVIWKWVHGYDPDTIDHINGDKADNRIANLRSVSLQTNARNVPMPRSNKSGEMGIQHLPKSGRWRVVVNTRPKMRHIGTYGTISEAVSARNRAWAELGFHENHGRKE